MATGMYKVVCRDKDEISRVTEMVEAIGGFMEVRFNYTVGCNNAFNCHIFIPCEKKDYFCRLVKIINTDENKDVEIELLVLDRP